MHAQMPYILWSQSQTDKPYTFINRYGGSISPAPSSFLLQCRVIGSPFLWLSLVHLLLSSASDITFSLLQCTTFSLDYSLHSVISPHNSSPADYWLEYCSRYLRTSKGPHSSPTSLLPCVCVLQDIQFITVYMYWSSIYAFFIGTNGMYQGPV